MYLVQRPAVPGDQRGFKTRGGYLRDVRGRGVGYPRAFFFRGVPHRRSHAGDGTGDGGAAHERVPPNRAHRGPEAAPADHHLARRGRRRSRHEPFRAHARGAASARSCSRCSTACTPPSPTSPARRFTKASSSPARPPPRGARPWLRLACAGGTFGVRGRPGGRRTQRRSSQTNPAEAQKIVNVVKKLVGGHDVLPCDIGIVTPYAAQVRAIKRLLHGHQPNRRTRFDAPPAPDSMEALEVSTVDGFQGREKEVIVFTCTRANANGNVGFLADPRRVNVMLPRARRGLIVVGHHNSLRRDPTVWGPWLRVGLGKRTGVRRRRHRRGLGGAAGDDGHEFAGRDRRPRRGRGDADGRAAGAQHGGLGDSGSAGAGDGGPRLKERKDEDIPDAWTTRTRTTTTRTARRPRLRARRSRGAPTRSRAWRMARGGRRATGRRRQPATPRDPRGRRRDASRLRRESRVARRFFNSSLFFHLGRRRRDVRVEVANVINTTFLTHSRVTVVVKGPTRSRDAPLSSVFTFFFNLFGFRATPRARRLAGRSP